MSVQVLTPGIKPIQWPVKLGPIAPEWDWFWDLDAFIIGMWPGQPWIQTRGNARVSLTLRSAIWDGRSFGIGLDSNAEPAEFNVGSDHPDADLWFNWGPDAFGTGPWTIVLFANFEDFIGSNQYINLISTSGNTSSNQAALIYGFTGGDTEVEFFVASMFTGDDPRPGSQIDIGSGTQPQRQIVYSYAPGRWRGYLDAQPIFDQNKTFAITDEGGVGGFWWGGRNGITARFLGTLSHGLYINAELTQGQISQLSRDPYGFIRPDFPTIGKAAAAAPTGATPKGPLGMPLYGPFAGPIAA